MPRTFVCRSPLTTLIAVGMLLGTCRAHSQQATVDPGLLKPAYLYEVVRHLYRWYLDETDVGKVAGAGDFLFWVRSLDPDLDPGDKSKLGQVILPGIGVSVTVKKADYTIEELELTVKNDNYKIVSVSRGGLPDMLPEDAHEVRVKYTDLRDDLFRTRSSATFPEGDLLNRLRAAVRHELADERQADSTLPAEGEQVVHLAPLSPVANEAWAFWETGRLLIRFASDIDLANAKVWEHEELAVKLYDIDEQVVVSLDEVAGSNAYLTRDQVGRALFNCIVLGRRITTEPPGGP